MTPPVEQLAVEFVEGTDAYVASVGESPVWHADEAALYWVDIPARTILRVDPATGTRNRWVAPEQIGCIAPARSGGVIAGLESGIFEIALDAPHPAQVVGRADARRVAAPDFACAGMRFNDGRCDRQGRFWAGTMVQDMTAAHPAGSLYRYTPTDGLRGPFVSSLIVQNGLAWSPDGRTMYLSDSHASRRVIWAFDYDVDDGQPTRQRVFADLHDHAGRPDGAAVDEAGCYWTCANDAGLLLRFAPDGRLDRAIALPFAKPAMCAFGGVGLDTLFVTSIRLPGCAPDAPDGRLVALRPGVRGMPEPRFDDTRAMC
ncbi:SMP-30/gluconolactonase/LRE family protein [Burkholderia cenocepacia]|uniref:SMP-30/gluconolactonase/LRE family protein n=1 Tax=Burkholderia cenocepacia TaxID=95486 RepID=UPI001B931700|nr:SMP-30/gluconolactonase/LRE family protein [Burkholderia cenocepacia]MBR8167936.1 SMP-30/gluconolactonase/LRE family protein [Burkholderia cenocepacia]